MTSSGMHSPAIHDNVHKPKAMYQLRVGTNSMIPPVMTKATNNAAASNNSHGAAIDKIPLITSPFSITLPYLAFIASYCGVCFSVRHPGIP